MTLSARQRGNALAEYGLAGAFMVGALLFLCTQMNIGDKIKWTQAALLNAGIGNGGTLTLAPFGKLIRDNKMAALKSEKICFASGNCIELPVIPAGATVAETAGGLGGDLTNKFADVLTKLAEEVKTKSDDPIVTQLITELANAGHEIGKNLNNTEDLIKKYDCDIKACSSENIPLGDLNGIQDRGNFLKNALYNQHMTSKYQLLKDYLAQNPQALATFPEAAAIIDLEYQQIGQILSDNHSLCASGTSCQTQFDYKPTPVIPSTKVYTNPETGASITETLYTVNGVPWYRSVTMDGETTSYQSSSNNGSWLPYTGTIPGTVQGATLTSMIVTISPQEVQNNSVLIHQDSNVICGSGGDVNNCVVDPNAGSG
ncbi:MAG: hypothetical protein IPK79_07620 [Vampirovibrionales bacterium]|nr:hypothetical protein [Vampirovibrionales bacterium]